MENNEYLPAVEFGAAIEKGLSRGGVACPPAPTSAIANSTNKFANQPGGVLKLALLEVRWAPGQGVRAWCLSTSSQAHPLLEGSRRKTKVFRLHGGETGRRKFRIWGGGRRGERQDV
eukprot:jgi/Botrbrau1/4126/Bobra.0192s0001.1